MGKSCSLQHITRVVGYEAKFIVALRAACWDHIPTEDEPVDEAGGCRPVESLDVAPG